MYKKIHLLFIIAITTCGTSTCDGAVYTDRYFTRSGYRIAVSPNPAKGNMTISLTDEMPTDKSSTQVPVTMTLYNINSTLQVKRWTFQTTQKNYSLNLQGIRMGQYILVVEKGKDRQSQKVTIE
jgi:Secretion system C-terminal sorting domain